MNLIEIKNQLVTFFIKNDTFNLSEEKHLNKIKVNSTQESIKKHIIISACKDLVESGMIKEVFDNQTLVGFILVSPLNSYPQQIDISAVTGEMIANIINQYLDSQNIKEYRADALNINEGDINQIVMLTAELLNNLDSDDKEFGGEKEND